MEDKLRKEIDHLFQEHEKVCDLKQEIIIQGQAALIGKFDELKQEVQKLNTFWTGNGKTGAKQDMELNTQFRRRMEKMLDSIMLKIIITLMLLVMSGSIFAACLTVFK